MHYVIRKEVELTSRQCSITGQRAVEQAVIYVIYKERGQWSRQCTVTYKERGQLSRSRNCLIV